METLPCELVGMIYEYLYMYRDVVGLSLTCSQLHNNVPNEQLRVLSILRSYVNINAEINNIKYYMASCHDTEHSLRIKNKAVLYTLTHFNGLHGFENYLRFVRFSAANRCIGMYYNYRGIMAIGRGIEGLMPQIIQESFICASDEIRRILKEYNIKI